MSTKTLLIISAAVAVIGLYCWYSSSNSPSGPTGIGNGGGRRRRNVKVH